MAHGLHGAGAAMDQSAGDPRLPQYFRRALNRIAFANCAQVEHYTRAGKLDGEIGRVQVNQSHADACARRRQLIGIRQMPAPAHKPPAPDQGRNGDVERAVAFPMELLCLLQKRKQPWRDPHRLSRGPRVEVGDFAAGAKQAEAGFQPFNLREGSSPPPARPRDSRHATRFRIGSPWHGRRG